MIKLGDHVKDKLTEFEGTAVARAEYLYGCVWIGVVPKRLHEGKTIEDVWFDEERLELKGKEEIPEGLRSFRGGPSISKPRRSVPNPNTHDWK